MADEDGAPGASDADLLQLSSEIVSAYVSRNSVGLSALPELIRDIHQTLSDLDGAPAAQEPAAKQKPAVPISRSVQHDYIVCLEDGKRLSMLKRYLRARYDLSPEEYRRKWGLPPEYPMVAPAYSERRSDFAKKIGLGKGVRRK
ncbi:MAG: MucR family transcriptional regulator [Caulobacter sp.]|nr:MucR family transcriptional regulator [Caulobacter sp.]